MLILAEVGESISIHKPASAAAMQYAMTVEYLDNNENSLSRETLSGPAALAGSYTLRLDDLEDIKKIVIHEIIVINTDSEARALNIFLNNKNNVSVYIVKDLSLAQNESLVYNVFGIKKTDLS